MYASICPYFSYIVNQIDSTYIDETPEIDSFGFSIYPLGNYSVNDLESLGELSTYILNRIFSCIVGMSTLDKYDNKLISTNASTKNIKITNEVADYNEMVDGTLIIELLNDIFKKDFFTIKTHAGNEYNSFLSKTQDFLNCISEEFQNTQSLSYDSIFTILWDTLILINSMMIDSDSQELDTDLDIVSIIKCCWKLFPSIHKNRNSICDFLNSKSMIDFNSISKPYNSKDIDNANTLSTNQYFNLSYHKEILCETYFECLLLITYYRCEYEKLV